MSQSVKRIGGGGIAKVGGFFADFKDFISQGNMLQLAVAFIMGVTFEKIIKSIVDDIFGPIIGLLLPAGALSELFVVLRMGDGGNSTEDSYNTRVAAKADGAITLNYGNLAQTMLNFLLTAFCLFIFIKLVYCLTGEEQENEVGDWPCPKCRNDNKEGAIRCGHCCAEPIYPEEENGVIVTKEI